MSDLKGTIKNWRNKNTKNNIKTSTYIKHGCYAIHIS